MDLITKEELSILEKTFLRKANIEGHPDNWDVTQKLEGVSWETSEKVFALLTSEAFPEPKNNAISKLLRLCGEFTK